MKSIYKHLIFKPILIGVGIFFGGVWFALAQSSDEDLSQALVDKIKKGGGDIVMRPSDLKEAPPPKIVAKPVVQSTTASSSPKVKVVEKASVHQRPWTYETGETGPENWGKLLGDRQRVAGPLMGKNAILTTRGHTDNFPVLFFQTYGNKL